MKSSYKIIEDEITYQITLPCEAQMTLAGVEDVDGKVLEAGTYTFSGKI